MRGCQRRTHGTAVSRHFKDHHVIAQATLRNVPSAHANRLQLIRSAQLCGGNFQGRLTGLRGSPIGAGVHQQTILGHLSGRRIIGRRTRRSRLTRGHTHRGASRCTRRRTSRNFLRCGRCHRRCRGDRRARAILRGARGCARACGHLGGGIRLHAVSTGNAWGVREENVLAARQNLVNGRALFRHELNRNSILGAQVLHLNHVRLLNVEALVDAQLNIAFFIL